MVEDFSPGSIQRNDGPVIPLSAQPPLIFNLFRTDRLLIKNTTTAIRTRTTATTIPMIEPVGTPRDAGVLD